MSVDNEKLIGVLIAQLGTPDAPTPGALRRYLAQFLGDPRVIDYPRALWKPILHGIILRTRPKRSAAMYKHIWTREGSPLFVYSQKQVKGLQERLGSEFKVVLGMTYGNPSIAQALGLFRAEGITRVVVLPMFPQYSSATTAPIYDAVFKAAGGAHLSPRKRDKFVPALRFVEPYFDRPEYIATMHDHLKTHIDALGYSPDKYILTYHGIPARYIERGDPYRQQCEATSRLLASKMGWADYQWTMSFQSQFGPERWLEPYTEGLLEGLHAMGVQRPLVFSPGFVTDCLETLDELGDEGRELFAKGGGSPEKYSLVPSLNDSPGWLDTLSGIVRENSGGWHKSEMLSSDPHSQHEAIAP